MMQDSELESPQTICDFKVEEVPNPKQCIIFINGLPQNLYTLRDIAQYLQKLITSNETNNKEVS